MNNHASLKPRFNLRKIMRHPNFMEYNRLFCFVIFVNIYFLYVLYPNLFKENQAVDLNLLSNMALINFFIGIMMRQQRLVNILFWIATRIPTSWPLWIRRIAGKVFHFGGLHSGSNIAGALWFVSIFWGVIHNHKLGIDTFSARTLLLTCAICFLLVMIIGTALSSFRARFHNIFERMHRFGGWTLLGLFWAQTISISQDMGISITDTPALWALLILTISVISPWLTLKKVPINVEKPSNHVAILRFNYGDTPFAGSSNTISLSPLMEWHSFANVPTPQKDGYRLIVSRAGDWTGDFINNPPQHVWVRGITTSGVARIETLFKRVVYVGTGSGIGPILPHLLKNAVPSRLIWATRSPRKTYGDQLVDEILFHTENPIIWDTDTHGKPDLSKLALQAVREFNAEAVIVISNQNLTRKVVYDLEVLGIPAYGAIWDS